MKHHLISRILTAATPILIVCIVLAPGVAAQDQDPIEGSWLLVVTPPPGAGSPFSAIGSFAAGGVFLATGENDRSVAPASEVHGNWQRIGRNRYGSTQYLFAFDSTGHPVAMLRNQWIGQLTGKNELGGPGIVSVCDIRGDNCVVQPGLGSITGKRMIATDALPAQ
jgi:hypothetical protein